MYIFEIISNGLLYFCCLPLALYVKSREARANAHNAHVFANLHLRDIEAQQEAQREAQREHPIVAVARRASGFPIVASVKLAGPDGEAPSGNGELAVAIPAPISDASSKEEEASSMMETGELIASPLPPLAPAADIDTSDVVIREVVAEAVPVALPPPPAPTNE